MRLTAARSLWRRRHRATLGFVIGYLARWLAVGAALAMLEVSLHPDAWLAAALGLACAAVWQLAPAKRRALAACHRGMPLAPNGWRADVDCVRFGWSIGGSCLLSCWALMLACVLADHSLPLLAAITATTAYERRALRPPREATFTFLLGAAVVYGLLGFLASASG